jgi:hypothetical protein
MPRLARALLWQRLGRIAACLITSLTFSAEHSAHAEILREDQADISKVDLGPSGKLRFYTVRPASGASASPGSMISALVVIHGYPRDVLHVLDAGVQTP